MSRKTALLLLSILMILSASTIIIAKSSQDHTVLPRTGIALGTAAAANQTLLSIDAQPTEASVGDIVIITGTLTEQASGSPVSNATVALSLVCAEAALSKSDTIRTGASGNFSYSHIVDKVGNYTVIASYAGDASHERAVDAFAYFRARIAVSLNLHTEAIEITHDLLFGSTIVNLTGSTDPPVAGAQIRIEVGGAAPEYAVTGANGVFFYRFTPAADGDYEIVAHYDGDSQHFGATSGSVLVRVSSGWATLIVVLVVIAAVLGIVYWKGVVPGKGRRGPPVVPPPGVACPSCGSRTRPGATFCKRCGTSLRAGTGAICPRCRTSNKPTAGFCKACGSRLR